MAVSKAQQRATAKYEAKNYDKLLLRLPKGKKDTIRSFSACRQESVNGFINRAIAETMKRDSEPEPMAAYSVSPEQLEQIKAYAKANCESVNSFINRAIAEAMARETQDD